MTPMSIGVNTQAALQSSVTQSCNVERVVILLPLALRNVLSTARKIASRKGGLGFCCDKSRLNNTRCEGVYF